MFSNTSIPQRLQSMSQLKLSHNMEGRVSSLSAKIIGKVQNSQVDGLGFFQGMWGG